VTRAFEARGRSSVQTSPFRRATGFQLGWRPSLMGHFGIRPSRLFHRLSRGYKQESPEICGAFPVGLCRRVCIFLQKRGICLFIWGKVLSSMSAIDRSDALRPTPSLSQEYVCWSRMQAEAGQALVDIVSRKELERSAGGGLFCWGVGNAPPVITAALAKLNQPVQAIFSIMKSRPKLADAQPARVVVWRKFFDQEGILRSLPRHVLITSRADSAKGPKTRHFALMCYSDRGLGLQNGRAFDPSAFRNAGGAGAPVGASQVTALLRRVSKSNEVADYEVNLSAWLTAGYWVRLADPTELSPEFDRINTIKKHSAEEWLEFVDWARRGIDGHGPIAIQQRSLI